MFKSYRHDKHDPAQCHSFEVHNVDLSIVNGLRRVILTDIPVVGFSGEEQPSVDVITNTGRLHNEIITHRFGLLPFHVSELDTDSFVEGQYTIELNKRNNKEDMLNVTTHDIVVSKDGKEVVKHNMFPVDMVSRDPILITRLRPGETLHVKGTAVKQTARFHAGFSPVSLCTLSYMTDPVEAAKKEGILDKERAFIRNEYGDPLAFLFEIEPKLSLSPRYLVSKAFEILIDNVTRVQQELYQEASEYVSVDAGDNKGYNFTIQGEDDTLGNILQSYVHVNHVRNETQAPNGAKVRYVGYYCPHPLDTTLVVNIILADTVSKNEYVDFMAYVCRSLTTQLQDMMNTWLQFAPKN